jgi:hypothetical protein
MKRKTMTQTRMLELIANVFATYKVDPHDEGAPVEDVVDHLIRCVSQQLPEADQVWFRAASRWGSSLWRFDHGAHMAGDIGCPGLDDF